MVYFVITPITHLWPPPQNLILFSTWSVCWSIFNLDPHFTTSSFDLHLTPLKKKIRLFWIWSLFSPILTLTFIWHSPLTFALDLHWPPTFELDIYLTSVLLHLTLHPQKLNGFGFEVIPHPYLTLTFYGTLTFAIRCATQNHWSSFVLYADLCTYITENKMIFFWKFTLLPFHCGLWHIFIMNYVTKFCFSLPYTV